LPRSVVVAYYQEVKRIGFQRNRKSSADELDRSRPYPVHVDIIDSGTEYKISVAHGQSGGIMGGKVEPFTVSTTSGLRRRIIDWLQTNYAQQGLRLGFIYYTTVSQRHPRCESCRYGTRDEPVPARRPRGAGRRLPASSQPVHCDKCSGAGCMLPGFGD